MDEVMKMLRAIVNGQSAMKQELLSRMDKMDERISNLELAVKEVDKRLDKIGTNVAFLEDDAPTREEYDELDERVVKVEKRVLSN